MKDFANKINGNRSTYIIAEIGVNHNGSIDLAKELIQIASEVGADAVKFQTFKTNKMITEEAPKAKYQVETDGSARSQKEMLKSLELSAEDFKLLIEHSKEHSIDFISSPFDIESLHLLNSLEVECFKIPSGEITNAFLLNELRDIGKPVILSTGMSTIDEIKDAIELLNLPSEFISILHCVSCYPTLFSESNLPRINLLKQSFPNNVIGYSDHTQEFWVPVIATAMGARIIEKHFTKDRTLPGPDHQASLDPEGLTNLVKYVRNIDQMNNANDVDKPRFCEEDTKNVARKSIVVSRFLPSGHVIAKDDLEAKRPGTGLSPMQYKLIIGRTLLNSIPKNQQIKLSDLAD
jgi:N,N'-diacetyllegionaminate synthase